MVWRRAAGGRVAPGRGRARSTASGPPWPAPWRPAWPASWQPPSRQASWLAGSSRPTAGTGGAAFGSGVPAAPACARASAAFADVRRRRGAAVAGVAGVASGRGVDAAGALGGTASADGGMGFFLRAIVGSATSFTNAGSVAAGRDNPGNSGENRRVRPRTAAPPYAPSPVVPLPAVPRAFSDTRRGRAPRDGPCRGGPNQLWRADRVRQRRRRRAGAADHRGGHRRRRKHPADAHRRRRPVPADAAARALSAGDRHPQRRQPADRDGGPPGRRDGADRHRRSARRRGDGAGQRCAGRRRASPSSSRRRRSRRCRSIGPTPQPPSWRWRPASPAAPPSAPPPTSGRRGASMASISAIRSTAAPGRRSSSRPRPAPRFGPASAPTSATARARSWTS